jgi:hypothetical protein
MRAHEAHAEGVAVSKGARVFTVFSTSKDHNQGSQALAGCILVDGEKLQVINRSPAYKNQYVHRRDSLSLAMLSDSEITKRIKLGLVTAPPNDEESEDDEEWNNFESSEEEEEEQEAYVFARDRRSSINLTSMAENCHDSIDWDNLSEDGQDSKRLMAPGQATQTINENSISAEDEASTVDGDAEVDLRER